MCTKRVQSFCCHLNFFLIKFFLFFIFSFCSKGAQFQMLLSCLDFRITYHGFLMQQESSVCFSTVFGVVLACSGVMISFHVFICVHFYCNFEQILVQLQLQHSLISATF